jgi:hypothetical protein
MRLKTVDREQSQAKVVYLEQYAVQLGLIENETGEQGSTLWLIRHCEVIKPSSQLWTEMSFHSDLVELLHRHGVCHPFSLSLCHQLLDSSSLSITANEGSVMTLEEHCAQVAL